MDSYQKCHIGLLACMPDKNMQLIMSSPLEVVETDNKCKMEQMLGVPGKVQTCAMDYGFRMNGEEIGLDGEVVTAELCSKIGTGVEKCVLDLKIDCFSKRENKFLSEIIRIAFAYAKETFGTDDEVQKKLEQFGVSDQQKEMIKCGLLTTTTSTTPSDTTTSQAPETTTSTEASKVLVPKPETRNWHFDGWSFFGGILLTLGLVAIGTVGYKSYSLRFGTEVNYNRF